MTSPRVPSISLEVHGFNAEGELGVTVRILVHNGEDYQVEQSHILFRSTANFEWFDESKDVQERDVAYRPMQYFIAGQR